MQVKKQKNNGSYDKVDIKFKMITRDKKLSLYDDKGDNSSRE